MELDSTVLVLSEGRFTYEDACGLARKVLAESRKKAVLVEMGRVCDTTTAALARLVVLRRDLLRSGRDLRLQGLHERAERVYQVNCLERILPRESCGQAA